jgi:hypothetical protein
MIDAKMQQFDKVTSNIYQNGISTNLINSNRKVQRFEILKRV